jgi:hypothetical protein
MCMQHTHSSYYTYLKNACTLIYVKKALKNNSTFKLMFSTLIAFNVKNTVFVNSVFISMCIMIFSYFFSNLK